MPSLPDPLHALKEEGFLKSAITKGLLAYDISTAWIDFYRDVAHGSSGLIHCDEHRDRVRVQLTDLNLASVNETIIVDMWVQEIVHARGKGAAFGQYDGRNDEDYKRRRDAARRVASGKFLPSDPSAAAHARGYEPAMKWKDYDHFTRADLEPVEAKEEAYEEAKPYERVCGHAWTLRISGTPPEAMFVDDPRAVEIMEEASRRTYEHTNCRRVQGHVGKHWDGKGHTK